MALRASSSKQLIQWTSSTMERICAYSNNWEKKVNKHYLFHWKKRKKQKARVSRYRSAPAWLALKSLSFLFSKPLCFVSFSHTETVSFETKWTLHTKSETLFPGNHCAFKTSFWTKSPFSLFRPSHTVTKMKSLQHRCHILLKRVKFGSSQNTAVIKSRRSAGIFTAWNCFS